MKSIVRILARLYPAGWRAHCVHGIALLLILVCCCQADFGQAARGNSPTQIQDASPAVPDLVVVSIKPVKAPTGLTIDSFEQDGISFREMSTKEALKQAFGVEWDRIIGIPGWADSDRNDIQAKVDGASEVKWKSLPISEQRLALIPILRNRFNLKFHHETRLLPVWVLLVAKGGPKLQEARPGDTYPNGLKGQDGPMGAGGFTMTAQGELTAQGISIEKLIFMLSTAIPGQSMFEKATIVDETGLTGKYDLTLRFTLENAFAPVKPGGEAGDSATSGPSLFTALQEQLGLKLESHKVPTDVIVIDHIDRPSEN